MTGRRQRENATQTLLKLGGEIRHSVSLLYLGPIAREKIFACLEQGLHFDTFSAQDFQRLVDERVRQMEDLDLSDHLRSCSTEAVATLANAAAGLIASTIFANKTILRSAVKSKGFYKHSREQHPANNGLEDTLAKILGDETLLAALKAAGIAKDKISDIKNVLDGGSAQALMQIANIRQSIEKTAVIAEKKRKRGRPLGSKNKKSNASSVVSEDGIQQQAQKIEPTSEVNANGIVGPDDIDTLLRQFE